MSHNQKTLDGSCQGAYGLIMNKKTITKYGAVAGVNALILGLMFTAFYPQNAKSELDLPNLNERIEGQQTQLNNHEGRISATEEKVGITPSPVPAVSNGSTTSTGGGTVQNPTPGTQSTTPTTTAAPTPTATPVPVWLTYSRQSTATTKYGTCQIEETYSDGSVKTRNATRPECNASSAENIVTTPIQP